jgi:hypothetical protein
MGVTKTGSRRLKGDLGLRKTNEQRLGKTL